MYTAVARGRGVGQIIFYKRAKFFNIRPHHIEFVTTPTPPSLEEQNVKRQTDPYGKAVKK